MESAAAATATATASLFDDDAEAALFDGSQPLVPGRPQTSCLSVGASTPPPESTVSLVATDLAGDLVDHLRLRVEIGSGGGFGDCTGFVGADVFDGPIADLSASGGVDTGWRPSADEVRTFRLTASVDDAGADAGALGNLVWVLSTADPIPDPEPTTDPTTDPTTNPTTEPDDEPDDRTRRPTRPSRPPQHP